MQAPSTPPSVGLLLVDHRGWILLQLRDVHGTYPDHWSTVGGALEPGETLDEALVREVFEETGYRLSHTVTIGSEGLVRLPDGSMRKATVFYGDYDPSQPIQCFEGREISFVDPAKLPDLPVCPGQLELILAALAHRERLRPAPQDPA